MPDTPTTTPATPFYKTPSFIASAVVLFVFIFDVFPFMTGGKLFHLSGLESINWLRRLASGIYFLFYIIPIAAAYLVIHPFLKEGQFNQYNGLAKWLVFGGLVAFLVFKLAGVGTGVQGGLHGLGFGFYVAFIASLFLPFESTMMKRVREARDRIEEQVGNKNEGGGDQGANPS